MQPGSPPLHSQAHRYVVTIISVSLINSSGSDYSNNLGLSKAELDSILPAPAQKRARTEDSSDEDEDVSLSPFLTDTARTIVDVSTDTDDTGGNPANPDRWIELCCTPASNAGDLYGCVRRSPVEVHSGSGFDQAVGAETKPPSGKLSLFVARCSSCSVAGVVVSCKIPILATRVRFPGDAL